MARQHRQEQQRRQQQQIQPPQVPSAVPHWMPKSQDATFALGREVNSFANMVHAVQQHREVNAEADVASKQSAPTASVQPRGARASQVTAVGFEAAGTMPRSGSYEGALRPAARSAEYRLTTKNLEELYAGFNQFTIATGTWHTLPRPPAALAYQAAVLVGNEIWCLGGAASELETLQPQLMVYNIQRKVWRVPQVVGAGPYTFLDDIVSVNTKTCTVQQMRTVKDKAPHGRGYHEAVVHHDSVYLLSGRDDAEHADRYVQDSVWQFDCVLNKWLKPSMVVGEPLQRSSHRSVAWGDQVLTYGGIQGLKETRQRSEDIVTLTIEGNGKISWTRDGNPAVRPPGRSAAAVTLHSGSLYILGGYSGRRLADGKPYNGVHPGDAWKLDIRDWRRQTAPSVENTEDTSEEHADTAAGGGWRKRARPQAGAGGAGQAAAKRHQTAPGSNWRPSAQAAQVPTPAAKAALGTSSAAAGAPMSGAYPVQLSGLMQLHTEHQHQLGLAGPSTSTPAAAPPGQAPFAQNSELLKEIEAMRQTYEQEQSTRQQIEWDRGRLRKDLQKCKEELQLLQQQREADAVRICVLEAQKLTAERSAAEQMNLRSEQEACNKGLKGQLAERDQQLHQAMADCQGLQADIDKMRPEKAAALAEVELKRQRISELQEQLKGAHERRQECEQKLDTARSTWGQAEKALGQRLQEAEATLKESKADLEKKQVDTMQSSLEATGVSLHDQSQSINASLTLYAAG
eukprot:jgi/Astpho2/2487/fgenesh1_pg.00048_%23_16_t